METIDIVRGYINRGWAVLPIALREKKPTISKWDTLRIGSDNVDQYFNGTRQNIGVILGAASGGLVDVDLDCAEAVALAEELLPETGAVFGRDSKRKSHHLYRAESLGDKSAIRHQDNDNGTIIELRTGGGKKGAQTVFPGSVHVGGEAIEWDKPGEPATVAFRELEFAVLKIAVATLAMRGYPGQGSRHDAALALGGFLARATNWTPDAVADFVAIIAGASGDDEIDDRRRAALDAAEAHQRGDNAYGLPTLIDHFGDSIAKRIAKLLGYRQQVIDAAASMLDQMNAEYCVASIGGKVRVLHFVEVERVGGGKRRQIELLSFTDFKNLLCNQFVNVPNGKPIPLGHWWLNHRHRRQYRGLVFRPGGPPEINGWLNLWQGWGIEPEPGDWSLMKRHIIDVLAAGNEELGDYIIKWVAWTFQNPGRPAEVALVFRSGEGSGKGMFARFVQSVFGQHGLQISAMGQITGRFNAHLMDCALLFADEAYFPGDKSGEGTLKRIITEPTLAVEKKGVDIIDVDNSLHIIMASNERWVVPAGMEARRFAVFDLDEKYKGDAPYFAALQKEIKNGGGGAMLHDLLVMDLKGWHPRQDLPKTDGLLDQQMHSLKPFDEYWFELLQGGQLPGPFAEPDDRTDVSPSSYLFEHIRDTVPKLKLASERCLAGFLKDKGCKRKEKVSCGGIRQRGWEFPPLANARVEWNEKLPTKWDENLAKWQQRITKNEWKKSRDM